MTESFPIIPPTKAFSTEGLTIEIEGLCVIAKSDIFPELLVRLSNYKHFIEIDRKSIYTRKKIQKEINNGVLAPRNNSSMIREIFFMSHMAACCELLKGLTMDFTALTRDSQAIVNNVLEILNGDYNEIEYRLHTADAVRTIQILKILGFMTKRTQSIHQLSLGAADGVKDIRAIHLVPSYQKATNPGMSSSKLIGNLYKIAMTEEKADDVIIVDGDPKKKDMYEKWNEHKGYNVLAINEDTMKALEILPRIMKENNLPLRDLVVALRIEHKMIPSVKNFLRLLKDTVADAADLIVTIGSGQSLEDFDGRTSTIRNMSSELTNLGMKPVIIKLHGQGALEQQYNDPIFGLSGITTYQILYCKLKKKLLEKI